jgi:cytochrome c oxidase subunit 2
MAQATGASMKEAFEHRRTTITLFAALVVLLSAPSLAGADPRIVEITAKRFEFSPAEVVLKVDEPVTLRLRSLDVTHGFFQRALGIDLEIQPGKATDLTITPRKAGKFLTICDHFCGSGHGNMKMTIVVQ